MLVRGEATDDELKLGEVVLWVRAPFSQSIAGRLIVRFAAASATRRLMRNQTSGVGRELSAPKWISCSGAQRVRSLEGRNLGGAKASRRETGGVLDRGTTEEDDPVTREALAVLRNNRRSGEPVTSTPRSVRVANARTSREEETPPLR